MNIEESMQNEVAFYKILEDIFKRNNNNQKALLKALHSHFFGMFDKMVMEVNYLRGQVDNLEEQLLYANIDQQSMLYVNAACIDKLKRNGMYENEHSKFEVRRRELINKHNAGVNIRGGDIPEELL